MVVSELHGLAFVVIVGGDGVAGAIDGVAGGGVAGAIDGGAGGVAAGICDGLKPQEPHMNPRQSEPFATTQANSEQSRTFLKSRTIQNNPEQSGTFLMKRKIQNNPEPF